MEKTVYFMAFSTWKNQHILWLFQHGKIVIFMDKFILLVYNTAKDPTLNRIVFVVQKGVVIL